MIRMQANDICPDDVGQWQAAQKTSEPQVASNRSSTCEEQVNDLSPNLAGGAACAAAEAGGGTLAVVKRTSVADVPGGRRVATVGLSIRGAARCGSG